MADQRTASAATTVVDKRDALQQKSDMLDEVNQLLDLMVGEKEMLQKRIEDLESEVTNQRTKQTINVDDNEKENEEKIVHDLKELKSLCKIITQERGNISQLSHKVNEIRTVCTTERTNLSTEITRLKSELSQWQLTSREQRREIKKLQEEALTNHSSLERLTFEKEKTVDELDKMKLKYERMRTSLLAVKGRTNQELKKQEEQRTEENKRREVETIRKTEERIKSKLYNSLHDKENEVKNLTDKLQNKEEQLMKLDTQLTTVTEGVANQLIDLEAELQSSRKELLELKTVLVSQREELMKTKELLKHERRQSHLLLTTSQTTLTRLLSQIDKERTEHQKDLHSLHVAMATQKQEDKLKLDRLKEVSMKRCGQLAREVWSLKNKN